MMQTLDFAEGGLEAVLRSEWSDGTQKPDEYGALEGQGDRPTAVRIPFFLAPA